MSQDKINAYMTLYTVLEQFIRLAAPFVPFITESIYQNLVRSSFPEAPISVHLCDYPVADSTKIDKRLEEHMEQVQHIVIMGRAARNAVAIKNRQPLSKLSIVAPSILGAEFAAIIKDELNIHELQYLDDSADLLDYRFKPQLKILGKRLGSRLNLVKNIIDTLSGRELMRRLSELGRVTLDVEGEDITLDKDDLLVEPVQRPGLYTQSDREYTVALHTELTEELIEEGFVREIISKVQTQRKEADFEVTDRIKLYYYGNERIAEIIGRHQDFIAKEVLAESIVPGQGENSHQWDINGELCILSVER